MNKIQITFEMAFGEMLSRALLNDIADRAGIVGLVSQLENTPGELYKEVLENHRKREALYREIYEKLTSEEKEADGEANAST